MMRRTLLYGNEYYYRSNRLWYDVVKTCVDCSDYTNIDKKKLVSIFRGGAK